MSACLLLLDMQHGILRSGRIPWESPQLPELAIKSAGELLGAARRLRMPVVHVGVIRPHEEGAFDRPRTQAAARSGKVPRQILPMAASSKDVEFVLAPAGQEEVVHKNGVSAFVGTRAELLFRNLGADDIFVAGAFTHMVVESTVRHGFDLGLRMHVVADACCSPTKALHEGALATGIPNFAFVLGDSKSAITAWETGVKAA
jgi:nicotinamidase-related amidase